jgi:hypothetical protein
MTRCAHCLKPIGLVEYKRWKDLYFCSKSHQHEYCKEREEKDRVGSFLAWLYQADQVKTAVR